MILSAFVMNQTHRWKDDYIEYDGVNVVGSLLLVYYALSIASWPFLVLNFVWFSVSIRDVFLDVRKVGKNKAHLGHRRK
jgi:hypothetical protein